MRRGGHHLEPQGSRATLSAVRRVFFLLEVVMTTMSSHQTEHRQGKAALRRLLRERRAAIAADTRKLSTRKTLDALMASDLWCSARTIALYRAIGDELDPSDLAARVQKTGQCLVYPRTLSQGIMHFHDPGQPPTFEHGPGGIEQPTQASRQVLPAEIDLVIVPVLGCDDHGVRLGYGGGFYDRYLPLTNAPRVGIGFSAQRLARLPKEDHDVRLDWYVDERGLQRLG